MPGTGFDNLACQNKINAHPILASFVSYCDKYHDAKQLRGGGKFI